MLDRGRREPGVRLVRLARFPVLDLGALVGDTAVAAGTPARARDLAGARLSRVCDSRSFVLSAASTAAFGWRTAPGAAWRLADLEWGLLNWSRYMISTHVVRVLVGTFFRSSPLWTWYMKLNGARIGRGVYINSLSISDHNLLVMGDGVVIGESVHLSGHTVEGGRRQDRVRASGTWGHGRPREHGRHRRRSGRTLSDWRAQRGAQEHQTRRRRHLRGCSRPADREERRQAQSRSVRSELRVTTRVPELLSIVVPVFNEEATVAARRRAPPDHRFADSPRDRRRQRRIDRWHAPGARRPARERVMSCASFMLPVNGGKGRAIRTGFEQARGTIVAIQDADLELNPAELATLVEPILAGESRCGLRLSISPRHARRAGDVGGSQPLSHRPDQSAVQRRADRHGDLLQESCVSRSPARWPSNAIASISSPRSPPSSCAPVIALSNGRSAFRPQEPGAGQEDWLARRSRRHRRSVEISPPLEKVMLPRLVVLVLALSTAAIGMVRRHLGGRRVGLVLLFADGRILRARGAAADFCACVRRRRGPTRNEPWRPGGFIPSPVSP